MNEPFEYREEEKRDAEIAMCDLCMGHYVMSDLTEIPMEGLVCYSCKKKLKLQSDDTEKT